MSSVDRAWLRMEDPTNLMVVNALLWLSDPLPRDALEPLLRERLSWIRRMRLSAHPGRLWTFWRGEELELGAHLHEHQLPEPADDARLHTFISELVSVPLDPARPLWEMHLIHRPGAGSLVLTRVHHSIGDGIAQLLLLLALTDCGPEPAPNPLRELFEGGELDGPRRFLRELMPTGMKLLLHHDHLVLEGQDQAPRSSPSISRQAWRLAQRGTKLGAAVGRDLASLLLRRPDSASVFRGPLVVPKRVAWSRPLPLPEVKALGAALGATVNDVLIAAMTGALRRYLVARGQSPRVELRAAVPVNLRGLAQLRELGNRFGLVFLTLPVGIVDIHERLAEIHARMDALKHSVEPLVTWGILELMGSSPEQVESLILDYFAKRVSFVMTNVPGPERRLYLAGRELEGMMFWVPQSGRVGLGLSIISYAGELRVGVMADAHLVPDPQRLVDAFEREFDALSTSASE